MTLLMSLSNTQLFWAHPELIGVTYNQLPTTIKFDNVIRNVSYVFDKDGYVVGCSIEQKETEEYDGNHQESSYTYTYTFTWE